MGWCDEEVAETGFLEFGTKYQTDKYHRTWTNSLLDLLSIRWPSTRG